MKHTDALMMIDNIGDSSSDEFPTILYLFYPEY